MKPLPRQQAEQEFRALEQRARKERDKGVQLEVTLGRYQYLDENRLIDANQKISALEHLLQELDQRQYPEYAALIMFDLGNNYFGKKHDYAKAFEHYINACNLARNFSASAFPDKKNILVGVANRYYTLGDYKQAQALLQEADSLPPHWMPEVNYNNQNTLGLVYRLRGSYDSAIACFRHTRDLALRDGDSTWAGIATGNIGISHYLQGQYAAAIPLLEEDIRQGFLAGNLGIDNAMNSLLILADIHLKTGSSKLTDDIGLARNYIDRCHDRTRYVGRLHSVMARYYARNGDYRQAYTWQDSATIYADSLSRRDNIYKLAQVTYRKELEKNEAELQRLSTEKRLAEFARNGLVIALLLLAVIAALVISRQRLKHRIRQGVLMARKELAEQDLRNATRELESYTRHLQEKNLLIERSEQELEKLRSVMNDKEVERVHNGVLQQLYASTILTDEEWDDFRHLFEQVHGGYLLRLKDKLPELTPADTRFIVLSKLKLSNKEMAGILGVQPETIRTYKHRLKKRFGLPEDADIRDFVERI